MTSARTKANAPAKISSKRHGKLFGMPKGPNTTAGKNATPVSIVSTRLPRQSSARKVAPALRPPPPSFVPTKNQVPRASEYRNLVQITPEGANWECRPDLRVGRSLIRKAQRGLYCLSWTDVPGGEKLLPYWRPGREHRKNGFDAGQERYWFGDGKHGYINMEGAELEGFLAGLLNDNSKFDPELCNCYIAWDDDTRMYWVFADEGWSAGTVCELYIFYGVQYWFHNYHLLTLQNRKLFHSKHLASIQKLVDSQTVLKYEDPFTSLPMPKTGTPVPEPPASRVRPGPGVPKKPVYARSRLGYFV